jgi:hypothetical protein
VNKPAAKFLFDECVSRSLMNRLATFLAETECSCEFAYLMDRFPAGSKDEDWLPRIAAEDWVVITADRGKQTKGGADKRLPAICMRLEITHVIIGAGLHQLPINPKLRAFVGIWDSILRAVESPRGSRISIFNNAQGNWQTKVTKPELGPKTKQLPLPASGLADSAGSVTAEDIPALPEVKQEKEGGEA